MASSVEATNENAGQSCLTSEKEHDTNSKGDVAAAATATSPGTDDSQITPPLEPKPSSKSRNRKTRAPSPKMKKQKQTAKTKQQPTITTCCTDNNYSSSHQRTNWGIGAAKERLEQAVHEWDHEQGRAIDPSTGQVRSLREFSNLVGIPYHTFRKYVAQQEEKRRRVGSSTGRQPLLAREEQEWIAQRLAAKGGGLLADEAVAFVMERHPELTKQQALQHFHRTLLKHHAPTHLHVPPKRIYRKRQQQQQQPPSALTKLAKHLPQSSDGSNGAADHNDNDHDDDDEFPNRTHKNTRNQSRALHCQVPYGEKYTETTTEISTLRLGKQQALSAINTKIKKLREQLLEAELEKEKIMGMEDSGSDDDDTAHNDGGGGKPAKV